MTPRNYPIELRKLPPISTHHAIIGMVTVANNVPLYYDATNEKALRMAGLAFSGNAVYRPEDPGKKNVTSFEFLLWVLRAVRNG